MRLAVTSAVWIGLTVSSGSFPLLAQLQNNSEKQLNCSNGNHGGDQARHCEVRELSLPNIGRLGVDAGQNGGVTIKGWTRGDVLVRARVEASGDTQSAADIMASRVLVDGSGGQVHATGPESENNSWWSVGYEIFVPQLSDVTVKANNGGVTISDVSGQIHFDAVNGGVHLKRVMGDITGGTVNGGIQVEMAGATWQGRQMELKTSNGGVTLSMPSAFSAHIQAETGMGRIHSDFPLPQEASAKSQRLDFNVGGGGAPIHITTGNGGINLKRAEAQ
jgi:hypothetical protein